MFCRIQALNYRCLSHVDMSLDRYHVLVGPNASGKTTFLDVPAFLGDLVANGLDHAIDSRAPNFHDLLFHGRGAHFELAVEMQIPKSVSKTVAWDMTGATARYQLRIALPGPSGRPEISAETFLFRQNSEQAPYERTLFPEEPVAPSTILLSKGKKERRVVMNKVLQGNDNFYPETSEEISKSWAPSFRLGSRKSTLGNFPEDELKFPVAAWFREQLTNGLQYLVLDSHSMRNPSPPGKGTRFLTDGSNLPWVIERLRRSEVRLFEQWIEHLRTALPNFQTVETIEREEDRHRYLVVCYESGYRAPSWVVSDGTLRMLALTLPAYLPDAHGIYLVEEPENGIHPSALETVMQSLSHVPEAQVIVASHSPGILSRTPADQILCFARTAAGATDIVRGDQHPRLIHWKGEIDPGTLLASGVLN
jgi:predicted ATPase